MSTEDQIAREVGERVQEKQKSKKRWYEAPKKVRAKRQVHFQEGEEEEGERKAEELWKRAK